MGGGRGDDPLVFLCLCVNQTLTYPKPRNTDARRNCFSLAGGRHVCGRWNSWMLQKVLPVGHLALVSQMLSSVGKMLSHSMRAALKATGVAGDRRETDYWQNVHCWSTQANAVSGISHRGKGWEAALWIYNATKPFHKSFCTLIPTLGQHPKLYTSLLDSKTVVNLHS